MKELICIVCPMGCHLVCNQKGKEILVQGNNCKRGELFAKAELTTPMRILTALVKTSNGGVVSVRTTTEIPKQLIPKVMKQLDLIVVKKTQFGQIVAKDILGTGADIIITSNV